MTQNQMTPIERLKKKGAELKRKQLLQGKLDSAHAQSRENMLRKCGLDKGTLSGQLRLADIYLESLRSSIKSMGGELKISVNFSGEELNIDKLSQ